jgi:hypothetical protein
LKEGVGIPIFRVLTNQPDYGQTYDGLEVSLVKRMSNRWMFRGNFSWNDWKQQAGAEAPFNGDPTQVRVGAGCSVCDDSEVVEQSTGSGNKGGVWIDSDWVINLAGVYQIPVIETNFGAAFTMRQGYPILYRHVYSGLPGGTKSVLVTDIGEHRLDNPYSLDLRLSKDFQFSGVGLEVSLDAFNVTNEQTILQRNADFAQTTAGETEPTPTAHNILERQSPRILRFGARLTF